MDYLDIIDITDEFLKEGLSKESNKSLIKDVHFPESAKNLDAAVKELSLREFTDIQLKLEEKRAKAKKLKGIVGKKGVDLKKVATDFIRDLPFELTHDQATIVENLVKELQQKLQPKEFRKRFLVKHAQKLVSVDIDEIAYFYSDGRLNFFKTLDNKKFVVDYTMDELEEMLDPDKYFRISRAFYVSIPSIDQIHDYFGNRLLLHLKPAVDKESIVSREKVADFKKWMGK